jgi:hypothetical protein
MDEQELATEPEDTEATVTTTYTKLLRVSLLLILLVLMVVVPVSAATTVIVNATGGDDGDGYIYNTTDGTFTQLHDASPGVASLNEVATYGARIKANATSGYYDYIRRGVFVGNTSSLPNSVFIKNVTFHMQGYSGGATFGLGNSSLVITGFAPTNPTWINNNNYNQFTNDIYADKNITTQNWTKSGDNGFIFNALGRSIIDKTGSSPIMMRMAPDVDNSSASLTWDADAMSGFDYYDNTVGSNLYMEIQYENATYYAYGDSLTRATGGGSLSSSGDDVYIIQMSNTHDATNYSVHNMDGTGQNSSWGLANFWTHFDEPYPEKVFIMFGTNDAVAGVSSTLVAQNLRGM